MRSSSFFAFLIIAGLFAWSACSDDESSLNTPGTPDNNDDPPATITGTAATASCIDEFATIPADIISTVGDLSIYYGHTSHGSQLMTGLAMVEDIDATYAQPAIHEPGGDLGHNGDLAWETATRARLADHADETDIVIWSWCGGCSDNTPAGIDTYLQAMSQLELDFPGIVFIYMTGHLDGTGIDGTLYANNERIRAYCDAHDKWFFDFADIESYDPDGTYYPDETDDCHWCETWCATHQCPECYNCAHSHCFNCYRKGQAFWWLLGRIVGWGNSA